MKEIVLTDEEMFYAFTIGVKRHEVHESVKRFDNKVIKSGEAAHIQGAVGEFAVSKALGLEWDGKFKNNEEWLKWRKTGHDVGKLEIRTTTHGKGRLILHEKDNDNSPYILVLLNLPEKKCTIVGWILGKDGKREEWWQDVGYGRPCYYVPQKELKPIDTL